MKYCSKCGKEIMDDAVICIHCGCSTNSNAGFTPQNPIIQNKAPEETKTLATCALVFSFLMPLIGLILGIVGACKYETPEYKSSSVSAIFISIVVWIISFVILFALEL